MPCDRGPDDSAADDHHLSGVHVAGNSSGDSNPASCSQKVPVQGWHGAPWRCAMSLAGKYAMVTGSSRGIGRGIALKLAEQGAPIALQHSHAAYLNRWFASRNPGAHHLQEETGIGGIGKQGGCVRTREHQHSRPGTYDLQIMQQAALVVGQECPTDYGNVEFVRSSREDCLVPIVGDAHSKPGMREYAVSRSQNVGIGTDGEHSGLARHPALQVGQVRPFQPSHRTNDLRNSHAKRRQERMSTCVTSGRLARHKTENTTK